jgi:hypothetical protein
MVAARSSETLTPIYQTMWHYIPKDTNIHRRRCESFIFHTL